MYVDAKKVSGRRAVQYESYDDLLQDAVRIAEGTEIKTLGNWSVGQIFQHLAASNESAIDGAGFQLAWPLRAVISFFLKKRLLTKPIPSGFKAPSALVPEPVETEFALGQLRKSIARLAAENERAIHPGLGTITSEEWDMFNLRHCEMHMSFIVDG